MLISATSSDSSDQFVQRAFRDADGVTPWISGGSATLGFIGGFQIDNLVDSPPSAPALSAAGQAGLVLAMLSTSWLAQSAAVRQRKRSTRR